MKQNSRVKRYMYNIGTKKCGRLSFYFFIFTKPPVLYFTALRWPFVLILPQDPRYLEAVPILTTFRFPSAPGGFIQ
jgi:hypothetical protein